MSQMNGRRMILRKSRHACIRFPNSVNISVIRILLKAAQAAANIEDLH